MGLITSVASILNSASKIVFILLAITVCVGFLFGTLESKDFMLLVGMAFTYYFTYKPNAPVENGRNPIAAVK